MASKKNTPEGGAEFIAALVPDPANVPQTVMSTGYLGASSEKDHVRLYADPQLTQYMEIPADALLHQLPAAEGDPLGAVTVWIKADANVVHKPEVPVQSNAADFFGRVNIGTGNIGITPQFKPTPVTIPPGICTGTGPVTLFGCPPRTLAPPCPPVTIPPGCPTNTFNGPFCPTRLCPPTRDNSPICNLTQNNNPICNFTRDNSPGCFTRNRPICDINTGTPSCFTTGTRSFADGCGTRTTTITGGLTGGGGGFGGFGGGLQPPPLGTGALGAPGGFGGAGGGLGRMGGITQFFCPTQNPPFCPTRDFFCPTRNQPFCPTRDVCPTRLRPFCPPTLECPPTQGSFCPPTLQGPRCPFTQTGPQCPPPVTQTNPFCGQITQVGCVTLGPGCPIRSALDACPSALFCPGDFGQTPVINPGVINQTPVINPGGFNPGIQPGGLF